MYIQVSTRFKVIMVTAITSLAFLLLQIGVIRFEGIDSELIKKVLGAFLIGLITYIGVLWVVSLNLTRYKLVIVPLFPALLLSLFTLFIQLSLYRGILGFQYAAFSLVTFIIFVVLTYFVILNANILNISSINVIPLARAGKSAQYIFSLIANYLFLTIIYNINISNILRIVITGIFFFYIVFQLNWVMSLSSKTNVKLTVPIMVVLFLMSLVLNLWPIPSEFIALIITVFLYIIFGIVLETSDKLSKAVIFEYFIVTILVIFFSFIVTDWGINGRLIG
jgi:hypothetical protein